MGFKQGAFMTVWEVKPTKSDAVTRVRLSSSKKNKKTDEYEQDFSGFCSFLGSAAKDAMKLRSKDKIKIGDCEVTTRYDQSKQQMYTDFKIFGFEMANGTGAAGSTTAKKTAAKKSAAYDEPDDDNCPF